MNENGRSMIEMLGTLAVIGVLSIGGIAGYRTAMDMHDANEIIDSVGKAATQLSVGFLAGTAGDTLTLEETTTPTGHTLTATKVDVGRFSVLVTGVEASVCENILNRDWKLPLEIKADNCATETNDMAFLFADDLGDGTTTAGTGGGTVIVPTFDPSTYQACESDMDCGGGVCSYGRCIPQEEACGSTEFWSESTECGDGKYCIANKCVKKDCESDDDCSADTDNPYCQKFQGEDSASAETYSMCVECTENAHCGDGYYCGGGSGSCYQSSVNKCMRMDLKGVYTWDNKTYYLSKNDMSWWDAENFCKALGKSLVPAHILNTKGVDGTTTSDDGTNKTALVGELNWGFGSPSRLGVWTGTDYGTSSSSSSKTCYAYNVYLSYGSLHDDGRDLFNYRALCWGEATNDDIPDFILPEEPETTDFETTE